MKRADPIRAYHHGDLRETVLSEASRRVSEVGHNKLSLRACARAVEVDVSAIYRHFPSKHHLLIAVSLRYFSEIANEMSEYLHAANILTEDDEVRALIGLAHTYVRFAVKTPHKFEALFINEEVRSQFQANAKGKAGHSPIELLENSLKHLESSAAHLKIDRSQIARIFWTIIHGQAVLAMSGFGPAEDAKIQRTTSQLIQISARGIGWNGAIDPIESKTQ